MNDLIILHLNGHELWFRLHFVWDIKEDSEYIVDADLLMGFENGAPIFTNGSPQWLVEMMNKELYKDILDQIYGQDIYA
jgi:hypothetical protein